jgi:hypothetical protein
VRIFIENRVGLAYSEVQAWIKAQNVQFDKHFGPAWSVGASVKYRTKTSSDPDASKDALIILAPVDVAGALGYHDWSPEGVPFGIVDPAISAASGEAWTVTGSHEAMELALDPFCNLNAQGPHPTASRDVFHWFEASDACQADAYSIGAIQVSNFLLPDYFTTQNEGKPTNYLKLPLDSFGVRRGGYVGFYDPKLGKHVTYMPKGDLLSKRRWAARSKVGPMRRAGKRVGE